MAITVNQLLTYGSAATNGAASAATPHTRQLASLPANGDSVIWSIAMVDNFTPGSISAVTDNQGTGNIYSLLYAQNDGSSGDLGRMEMWGCPAVTVSTGPLILSAAYSGTYEVQSAAMDVSGLASSSFLDRANGNGFTTSTGLTLANGSANVSANDLVLASIVLADYATNAPSNPATTGYTTWGTGTGSDGGRETQASYKIVSAIETSSATWAWTGAEQGAAIIVTLKGAASPGSGPSGFNMRFGDIGAGVAAPLAWIIRRRQEMARRCRRAANWERTESGLLVPGHKLLAKLSARGQRTKGGT